jgi:metal-responsive CopG/Arc/MetJ family transcriptional regulator
MCYYQCDMKYRLPATTIRRSVALPSALLGELDSVAPPELRTNLNRLVIVSLQEYISRRRQLEFESAIAAMAEDPQVQTECTAIARDFAATEMDGLGNG